MLLILLFTSIAVADENPVDNLKQWRVCQMDTDCTLVEDCCHSPASINKIFLEEYKVWIKKIQDMTFCQKFLPGKWPEGAIAICDKSSCNIKIIPKAKQSTKKKQKPEIPTAK